MNNREDFIINEFDDTELLNYNGTDEIIYVPKDMGIYNIGQDCFADKDFIKEIHLPYNVYTVQDCAFAGCKNLTLLDIPEVTSMEMSAIKDCPNLKVIVSKDRDVTHQIQSELGNKVRVSRKIPTPITDGSSPFEIEDGVLKDYIGDDEHVEIPDGVTSIGDSAFKDCDSIRSIKIPRSVTEIGNDAFYGCVNLGPAVDIPNTVTYIGQGAFAECRNLKMLFIPEGVTIVGAWVVDGCLELEVISLPDSVEEVYANDYTQSLTGYVPKLRHIVTTNKYLINKELEDYNEFIVPSLYATDFFDTEED